MSNVIYLLGINLTSEMLSKPNCLTGIDEGGISVCKRKIEKYMHILP